MRNFSLVLLLALAACFEVEMPTGANDFVDLLTNSAEVASISCVPARLDIATDQTGTCSAFNAAGTVIEINGFSPIVWTSNNPQAVSIRSDGSIFAGFVVATCAMITGTGTNNTSATFCVESF